MAVPIGITSEGNVLVQFVPVIAAPGVPKLTEISAAGAVPLHCALTKDGLALGGDQQTGTDDRLCSRQSFEIPGSYTDTLDITYVHNPQATLPADNLAYTTLKQGVTGYVVVRWGKPWETALAVGNKVDVYPVTAGIQRKQAPEANSSLKVAQKMFVTGPVVRDVALVA